MFFNKSQALTKLLLSYEQPNDASTPDLLAEVKRIHPSGDFTSADIYQLKIRLKQKLGEGYSKEDLETYYNSRYDKSVPQEKQPPHPSNSPTKTFFILEALQTIQNSDTLTNSDIVEAANAKKAQAGHNNGILITTDDVRCLRTRIRSRYGSVNPETAKKYGEGAPRTRVARKTTTPPLFRNGYLTCNPPDDLNLLRDLKLLVDQAGSIEKTERLLRCLKELGV